MLIRFFKENDLIGCGGDTQPIRLQVGTLSQSDYRVAHTVVVHTVVACAGVACIGDGHTRVARTRVAHAGVVGTLSQSMKPIRVAHAGVTRALVVRARVACTGVAWARTVHVGVVGTLSQSVEPIRVARTRVVCAGVEQLYPLYLVDRLRTSKAHHCLSLVTIGCP